MHRNTVEGTDSRSIDLPEGLTVSEAAWPIVWVDTSGIDIADAEAAKEVDHALLQALRRVHPGAVEGQALVKVHIGESNCMTRMRPRFASVCASFARAGGATGVAAGDTTVAYTGPRGHRQNPAGGASRYLELASDHGWSEAGPSRCPFVVLDRPATSVPGVFEFEQQRRLVRVEGIQRFHDFHLAGGFAAARFVLNNAHLTLHALAGVAGCLKSVAMGLSSLAGKLRMHQSLLPQIDAVACTRCGRCVANCPEHALSLEEGKPTPTIWPDDCIGCGECAAVCQKSCVTLEGEDIADWMRGEETLSLRMTDYAIGLMHGKWEHTVHVLHMYDVTRLCDCVDDQQEPITPRALGFLIGKNPFAIDRFAAELLARALEEDGKAMPSSAFNAAKAVADYASSAYGVLVQTPIETLRVQCS